ncbi:hypothetical protein DESC_260017 [Desulfosarcina cetonica]|nr:hypothetical protein DESC_260017 [Desulfosarcina cetonica]
MIFGWRCPVKKCTAYLGITLQMFDSTTGVNADDLKDAMVNTMRYLDENVDQSRILIQRIFPKHRYPA